MQSSNRCLVVLYGSQTGTAEEVAERIARHGHRLHFTTQVSSMDSFDIRQLPSSPLVVYVASTTGQGEEPDNMKKTWKFLLRKSLPPNSLAGQRFGVLGLGDSSYAKFNHVAKKLNKRLVQLGGIQLLPPGLGDDQHDLGPDFVIDPWLESFWNLALQLYPLPSGLQPISNDILPPPKYRMKTETDNNISEGSNTATTVSDYHQCPVVSCNRQTPENHFQDVRLLRIDVSQTNITYSPGDVAELLPRNLNDNVETFFKLFPKIDPETLFSLQPTNALTPLPSPDLLPRPCTWRQAVSQYFDIQSVPRRYFFELLAHFTTDELEKEKFIEFTTAEGQQDLYDYCNRPKRNILEVLHDFRHTTPNIPPEYLFDLIPPIKPRSFSIASSQRYHGSVLELLVAVVHYKTILKTARRGLCSTWISNLDAGTCIPIRVRRGTLKFPPSPESVVMVGPGTGVAPFRSFVLETADEKRETLLYFGCRNKNADFFFETDFARVPNLDLDTAFSRDQEDKIYVQHRMNESREKLCRMILDNKGWMYVAGNSKNMPTQVRKALVNALATKLGSDDAEKFVENMEITGRYQTETWS